MTLGGLGNWAGCNIQKPEQRETKGVSKIKRKKYTWIFLNFVLSFIFCVNCWLRYLLYLNSEWPEILSMLAVIKTLQSIDFLQKYQKYMLVFSIVALIQTGKFNASSVQFQLPSSMRNNIFQIAKIYATIAIKACLWKSKKFSYHRNI